MPSNQNMKYLKKRFEFATLQISFCSNYISLLYITYSVPSTRVFYIQIITNMHFGKKVLKTVTVILNFSTQKRKTFGSAVKPRTMLTQTSSRTFLLVYYQKALIDQRIKHLMIHSIHQDIFMEYYRAMTSQKMTLKST